MWDMNKHKDYWLDKHGESYFFRSMSISDKELMHKIPYNISSVHKIYLAWKLGYKLRCKRRGNFVTVFIDWTSGRGEDIALVLGP